MKIVSKLQAGGLNNYLPIMTDYLITPEAAGGPAVAGKSSRSKGESSDGDKSKSKYIDKIFGMLEAEGLPSDVDAYTREVSKLFKKYDSVYGSIQSGEGALSSMSEDELVSTALQLNAKLQRIKNEKDKFTLAKAHIVDEKAQDQPAITGDGRLIVIGEDGKPTQVSAEEAYENYGKYKILSNSEVAAMRYGKEDYAFNSNMTDIMEQTVGIGTITKYLSEQIANISEDTTKVNSYINSSNPGVGEGIKLLIQNGPEGIYKLSQENTSAGEKVRVALTYLQRNMPSNYVNTIKGVNASYGYNPNDAVINLLGGLLTTMPTKSKSTDVSFQKEISGPSGSSGDSEGIKETNQGVLIQNDIATPDMRQAITINPHDSVEFVSIGNKYSSILDNDGSALITPSLEYLKSGSQIASILDGVSMYFGDSKIQPEDLSQIYINGTEGAIKINLPSKRSESGGIIPDFDLLNKISKVQKEINDLGITDENTVKQKYKSVGLTDSQYLYYIKKDESQKPSVGFSPFLVMQGYSVDTGDNNVADESSFKLKIDNWDSRHTRIAEHIRASSVKERTGGGKNGEIDAINTAWANDDIYVAPIFMHVSKDNVTSRTAAGTVYVPKDSPTSLMQNNTKKELNNTNIMK